MADQPKRRRANGEGSLFQYRGRWRGALTWIDAEGVSHRTTIIRATQAEARRALAALQADKDAGRQPVRPSTVSAYLTTWLEGEKTSQRIRPATWRQYEQIIRHDIIPAIGAVKLADLSPSAVERMTHTIAASGRIRTAVLARVVLRKTLSDAERDGLVHRNVAALARPERTPQRDLKYLTPTELRQLLAACGDDRLGALVTVAATTGLRIGEVLGLAWEDVDADAAAITVREALARSWEGTWTRAEPKTARSRRTLNLPAVAITALRHEKDRQDALAISKGADWRNAFDLVFTNDLGRPLRPDDVNHAWHRLLRDAGLPPRPFHSLRHTNATALLSAGVPLKVVSDQLGHSTITLTANTYTAVVPELRREAAAAMDRILAGDATET